MCEGVSNVNWSGSQRSLRWIGERLYVHCLRLSMSQQCLFQFSSVASPDLWVSAVNNGSKTLTPETHSEETQRIQTLSNQLDYFMAQPKSGKRRRRRFLFQPGFLCILLRRCSRLFLRQAFEPSLFSSRPATTELQNKNATNGRAYSRDEDCEHNKKQRDLFGAFSMFFLEAVSTELERVKRQVTIRRRRTGASICFSLSPL